MIITLPPLPHALEALEPHLSRRSLAAHDGLHKAACVAKTRTLSQRASLESASLENVVLSGPVADCTRRVAARAEIGRRS
ncbi:MAG: hypothetical protein ACRETT_08260 [Steroidobacteraceae bacterium]